MADEPMPNNSYIVGSDQPLVAPLHDATKAVPHAPKTVLSEKLNVPVANPVKKDVVNAAAPHLVLPMTVITVSDVGRLIRETEAVDNFLHQAAIRQSGTQMQLPRVSRLFEEIVSSNRLNLLQVSDRQQLGQFLQLVRSKAPTLHVSFSADPSPIFQQRFITWIRQQMHPYVLLQIGLHPNIGAGCVIRTTNKYFDFSLRHRFSEQRKLLISKLSESPGAVSPVVVAAAKEVVTS